MPSPRSRTDSSRIWRSILLNPAWLALLGFALLTGIRAIKVDGMVSAYTGCHQCIIGGLVHHDLAMLALLAGLLGLDLLAPWRWLRALLRLCALALVIFYALDLAVFASFAHRLYLGDLLAFGGEGGAIGGFVHALLQRPDIGRWFATALLVLLIAAAICWKRDRAAKTAVALFLVAAATTALWATPLSPARYVHPEIVDNLLEVNQANSANHAYSLPFRRALLGNQPAVAKSCSRNAHSNRPDVILVAVESLSAYQSKLLGGDMDALPLLDAIARENHYFSRFLANGFNTNGGRIALYTGRAPLPPPGMARTLPLRAYGFTDETLTSIAHETGYTSHYFTSGDLGFVNSTPWLETLGFDSIEGAESPFYKGMKRWQFDAPEDKALFDRVLDWLDHRTDRKPFLATLLTVTSHPPFVDPRSGKIDQLTTFRYVDAQLARFYRKLEERHFFDHGVLMITGDHRSMTPLHADEYQRWGERAFARVPMIVVGDVNMPPVVQQSFAQTDVPFSFSWLAGAQTCLDAAHGNFARPDPQAPAYILHASGDRPERVNVFFGQKMGGIILDGDDSRWQGPRPENWQQILDSVNLQRIREADIARRKGRSG
ncbi:MAG: LTA synthase family protein [Rhodanobacteraceae bacterium]